METRATGSKGHWYDRVKKLILRSRFRSL